MMTNDGWWQVTHYTVIPERAGDGTLYEVANLTGKVVSAHPMALRAARAYAEFREADSEMQARQDEDEAAERRCAELDP